MVHIQHDDLEADVNLDTVQSIMHGPSGVEVNLYDPNASFMIACPPPVAKAIYAKLYNALYGPNAETTELSQQTDTNNG